MTKELALRIKELMTGDIMHSTRALCEVICAEYPEKPIEDGYPSAEFISGNQMYGYDLIAEATHVLGESSQDWHDMVYNQLEELRNNAKKE